MYTRGESQVVSSVFHLITSSIHYFVISDCRRIKLCAWSSHEQHEVRKKFNENALQSPCNY